MTERTLREKARRALGLTEHDTLVTAWAERASGPGWLNFPVWVLIQDGNGKHRVECLQPHEQNDALRQLFDISVSCQKAMVSAVRSLVYKPLFEAKAKKRR